MINVPTLAGIIRRRILINYRADPAVLAARLPPPFRPKLHGGQAIAGICLIRLEQIRPAFLGLPVGLSSENAAHRMAVEWDDPEGRTQEGVFVPRRDTDSAFNSLAGGRLFPGQHRRASFAVCSTETDVDLCMHSQDGAVTVTVRGQVSADFPPDSCFGSLADASAFFQAGRLGYSARAGSSRLDGMRLSTKTWQVEALAVSALYSSFYADEQLFPPGSLVFDHALLMRNIEHEWQAAEEMDSGEG